MFNSAPLVVTPSGGSDAANARVFVTTTRGGVYCYAAGAAVGNGPVWTTYGEIGAVPDSELPESTYSYISVTSQGTLLVTGPAPGADWQDEKYVYAIVNGVQTPSNPGPAPGLGAGTVVGILAVAVLVAGAGGGFAYVRVPGFRSAVDSTSAAVKNGFSKLSGQGYHSLNRGGGMGSSFVGGASSYGDFASSSSGGTFAGSSGGGGGTFGSGGGYNSGV
jgi:hypothetical protein